MNSLITKLFPICRSITGEGVRETLRIIGNEIPLTVYEVPSGTDIFDWKIPDEWNINDAYVKNDKGERVIDFQGSNLRVVGYSIPFEGKLSLDELKNHLHTLPDQPDLIPYVTSYYEKRWGFCLSHNEYIKLEDGVYEVKIDATLEPGFLTYADLVIEGESDKEVLISTYICHPSMGNNELSGPVVTTALARWLMNLNYRRYTYRIVFVPETIGSIVYLSRNLDVMKKNTVAGFVVTCVGDDRAYSLLQSPWEDTLSDRLAKHVLKHSVKEYKNYYFWEKGGSDEQQYCSPNVRLPVVSVMRSKYGGYPEYHTSLDDLSLITPSGLEGGYEVLRKCLMVLENNYYYRVIFPCEPHIAKRNTKSLYGKRFTKQSLTLMRLLNYLDGDHELLEVCDRIDRSVIDCIPIIKKLLDEKLIIEVHRS